MVGAIASLTRIIPAGFRHGTYLLGRNGTLAMLPIQRWGGLNKDFAWETDF